MATSTGPTRVKGAIAQIRGYLAGFKVLKECPPRYWGVQTINTLDCTAYFAMFACLKLFLTKDTGYDTVDGGYLYTLFGAAAGISLMTFCGPLTDWLGVRVSLLVGVLGKVVSGGIIPAIVFFGRQQSPGGRWLLIGCLIVLGASNGVLQTVYQLANRRFSTKKSESAAFSMWYLFMNVGGFFGGMSVDWIHDGAKLPYTYVFVFAAAANLLALLVLPFVVRTEEPADPTTVEEEKAEAAAGAKRNPLQIMLSVVRQAAFWKLIVLVSLFVPVRAVFLYMSAIMPEYWTAVIGDNAPVGFFSAINPFLIVVGILVLTPFIGRMNIFKGLTGGAIVSASSLFILVLPWHIFSANMATAYTRMTVLSMAVLSVGEILWSPKLQHITAAVAPKNQVATYAGVSTASWFIAKTFAGGISGHMINRWCPKGIGPKIAGGTVAFVDSPEMLWLILGVAAVIGPIVAILIRGWLFGGKSFETQEEEAK